MGVPPAKLHENSLANARGSDRDRDRDGAISAAKKVAMRECFFDSVGMGVPPAKLHENSLANARGSDRNRDREGAISAAGKLAIRECVFDSVKLAPHFCITMYWKPTPLPCAERLPAKGCHEATISERSDHQPSACGV